VGFVSRIVTLIAGLGLFACTVGAGIRLEVPRIEADLETRARVAAQKANVNWLEVRAVGQTLRLTGNAPNYTARSDAEVLARSIWGVAAIDNQIVLVGNGDSCREELEAFRVADPLRFAPGSAQLEVEAEQLLMRLAALALNCNANLVVALADRPDSGTLNDDLDRARLEAVQRYLEGSGVPPEQLVGGSPSPLRIDHFRRDHVRRGEYGRGAPREHIEVWVAEDAA
jgi:outer membrane protein OmpA-like peptidoglycan-associated protein